MQADTSTIATKRTAWSPAEDDALLRAWAHAVERRVRGLPRAFAAVCAAASIPQERTANSLQLRLNVHQRMFKIARAFNERHQQSTPDNSSNASRDTAASTSSSTVSEYSSESWFELRKSEQRRWFASVSTNSYKLSEMPREMFDRMDAIFKCKHDSQAKRRTLPPQAHPARERTTSVRENPLSTTDLRASIARLRDAASSVQQQKRTADELLQKKTGAAGGRDSGKSIANGEDDPSCTESDEVSASSDDDEIVSRSPVATAKPEPEPSVKAECVLGSVDPDFLELVSSLESQARHLGGLFKQSKRRRREESRERQYIWRKVRIDLNDRDRVLKEIELREEELRRERAEWDEERRSMKQALAQVRGRKATAPPPQPRKWRESQF